jgi:hypothetical protein
MFRRSGAGMAKQVLIPRAMCGQFKNHRRTNAINFAQHRKIPPPDEHKNRRMRCANRIAAAARFFRMGA